MGVWGWLDYLPTNWRSSLVYVAMVDCDVLPLLIDKLKELGSEAVLKRTKMLIVMNL